MLDAVAELAQHRVGDIRRVLGHEVDPDPLGADQADHLLDLLQERLRRVPEQEVGLVEEEGQLGPVGVAHLRQDLEQLRHQPEEEGGVEPGRGDQLVRGQDVHVAAAAGVLAHEVRKVEGRLAEQAGPALVLEHQELALDRRHRRGRDIAVARAEGRGVLGGVGQGGLEVLQVEEQEALVIRRAEDHREHAFLDVVQLQHARDQEGADLGDGGPDGVPLLAEQVPEDGGRRLGDQLQVHGPGPGEHLLAGFAGGRDAAEVALDVRREDRDAGVGQALRQDLQRHGLAGPGGPGHQAVAVGAVQPEDLGLARAADQYAARLSRVRHGPSGNPAGREGRSDAPCMTRRRGFAKPVGCAMFAP